MPNFLIHISHFLFSAYFIGVIYHLHNKGVQKLIEIDGYNEYLFVDNQNDIFITFLIINIIFIVFIRKIHKILAISPFFAVILLNLYEIKDLKEFFVKFNPMENYNFLEEIFYFLAFNAILILFFSENSKLNNKKTVLSKEILKEIKRNLKYEHMEKNKIIKSVLEE